jgi:hypothetical protein
MIGFQKCKKTATIIDYAKYMSKRQRKTGRFWHRVRAMIWDKAQQLYQMEQAVSMGGDFKGLTATRGELRESGYFYQAKLVVLRNVWRERKGLPTIEEEEAKDESLQNW